MASSNNENVVNSSQSTGESSPVDVHAIQDSTAPAEQGAAPSTSHNDKSSPPAPHSDDPSLGTYATDSTINLTNAGQPSSDIANSPRAYSNVASMSDSDIPAMKREEMGENGRGSVDVLKDSTNVLEDSTAGDSNIGSDTDISRADSAEQNKDGLGNNVRSSSLKKPTSFKSVSITKSFLAKTATAPVAAAAASKVGDKVTASSPTLSIAKPRLVAKSGSGLRDIPRARPSADGATDGATVWNKNRPAPPQPAKQFTDEELKQQYGIHLATRLQTDEAGSKQSKWADMEDEEDDWAPEALEWMDGTKSSTVATEQPKVPVPEPVKVLLKKEDQPTTMTKPTLTALKKASSSGTPKTILRPGAAQLAKQDGTNGLGGPDQKPSLVAKANATTVKSPWAPLPPMEKQSPVFVPPPAPQHASSFGHRDAHGFDAMPPPSATREIETDTFDRSWRDGERGSRELFNSQSGRYEPAPERRRGSIRQDHGYNRQPALLQRPSQQDIGAHPGPSAAFQTRSSGQLDGSPFSHRRGSSVSGTSSSFAERRMSLVKGQEVSSPISETRGVAVGHDVEPQTAKAEVPTAPVQPVQPVQAATPAPTVEEEVARQKKVMQEKREIAIRRRKEEDEAEEAARRERIRIKMESLGLPPVEAKSTATETVTIKRNPSQLSAEPATVAIEVRPITAVPAQAEVAALADRQSLPENVSSAQGKSSDSRSRLTTQPQPSLSPLPPPAEVAQLPTSHLSSPNARSSYQAQHGVIPSSYSSPGEQKAQPSSWKSPALDPDSFATWGNGNNNTNMTAHSSNGNMWGPPTSSRLLGNGTFENRIRGLQNQANGIIQPSAFTRDRMARVSPQTFGQQDSAILPQHLTSDQQMSSSDLSDPLANDLLVPSQSSAISPVSTKSRPYQPAPIAPPQRNVSRSQEQQPVPHRGAAAWGHFAAQAEIQSAARKVNVSEQPMRNSGPTEQRWKETFKQTRIKDDWNGGPREIMATEKTIHGDVPSPALPLVVSPAPPISQTQVPTTQQAIGESWPQTSRASTVRLPIGTPSVNKPINRASARELQRPIEPPQHLAGQQQSRFFPSTLYGGSPPPEEQDHPVNYGDASRPLVNLPAPKPQVRLPPLSGAGDMESSPVIMPQRAPSYRAGAQPLVQSSDWQARFNGLFGRVHSMTATPPSPPRTPPKVQALSPAVLTFSKADLVLEPELGIATVSLPWSMFSAKFGNNSEEEMTTKAAPDEIFDGELSFGSIPKVSLPRGAIYPEPFTGRSILKMRTNSKFEKPVDAQTKEALSVNFADGTRPGVVTVSIAHSGRAAKDVFIRRNKTGPQSRKPSAKFSKNKGEGSSKEGSSAPNTPAIASPMPKRGSRQSSFQKVPSSVSPKVESLVGAISNGPTANKRSRGPKFPKGRGAPVPVPANS